MTQTLEELATKYPQQITQIIPGEQWEFPQINYELFSQEERASTREFVEGLQEIMSYPYVVDSFPEHNARRVWRDRLDQRERELVERNSLRINATIQGIKGSVEIIQLAYQCTDERVKQKAEEIDRATEIRGKYDTFTTEEKIRYVRNLKQKVYEFLECLAQLEHAEKGVETP